MKGEHSNGRWIQEEENIVRAAEKHFKQLFNLPNPMMNNYILQCIPQSIFEKHNRRLTSPSTEEEMREAIFNLNPNSIVGQDGYNRISFSKLLGYIKEGYQGLCSRIFQRKKPHQIVFPYLFGSHSKNQKSF